MDAQLARFFRAWCAPELTLLGFRLTQPYCLGHSLLLEALESPFAALHDPGALIAPEDLLLALKVCSQARWPFRYVRTCSSVWNRLQLTHLRRRPSTFRRAVETFVAWMAECSGKPEFWQQEVEVRDGLTAPTVLTQASALLLKTPLTEERIWTMPMGAVSWYHGALAEQEGTKIRFAYDSDSEEENNAPDLAGLTEEQLYEIVQRDCGNGFAARWLQARKEARL